VIKKNRVAVVIPCFNEEKNVANVLLGVPKYVDYLIVVDDASTDETVDLVRQLAMSDLRIHVISLSQNLGVGGAISRGYLEAQALDVDVTVVMAGDGQMDPVFLKPMIDLIIDGQSDVVKTNRLGYQNSKSLIPRIRYIGNYLLSLLTKVASGYWQISDAQSGYVAINKNVLLTIDWGQIYPRYGQPNDLLIQLNIHSFRIIDFITPPRYGVGEESKMVISRVIRTVPWLLFRGFLTRLWKKYVVQQSHPLILFYLMSLFSGLVSFFFAFRILFSLVSGESIPEISALAFTFCSFVSMHSLTFAMWFDMQENKDLQSTFRPARSSFY
jgi:glycosyltransferase involved in cell wall biosynthesis